MVFYFECSDPQYTIYMGRDKHENEHLIANGWPEDVWFHVDNWSSAHVYLRMPTPEVSHFFRRMKWIQMVSNHIGHLGEVTN